MVKEKAITRKILLSFGRAQSHCPATLETVCTVASKGYNGNKTRGCQFDMGRKRSAAARLKGGIALARGGALFWHPHGLAAKREAPIR
jgi:hypothetical protein